MLYKIFMAYDKRRQTYALGEPVQFSVGDVRQVRLTGTRKRH